jgi:pyruvate formate lyase activating enzyme
MHCPFCQNWHISQSTDASSRPYKPQELISEAHRSSSSAFAQIAYTYSEPLVHFEYLLDCMKEARKAGIANVLVTNGCIVSKAAEEILALTDAANIDLKCFSNESYRKVLGGDLSTVLDFIRTAVDKGVHVEITTLIVPGFNDSTKELDACMDFLVELNKSGNEINKNTSVPWHLSAYHPNWKWKAPPTSPQVLHITAARARERLLYVYTGNIPSESNDTICRHCGKTIVSRKSYMTDTSGIVLKNNINCLYYYCASCGKNVPIRY